MGDFSCSHVLVLEGLVSTSIDLHCIKQTLIRSGAVYSATDLKTNSVVACKLEHLEFEWASIELEVEVYESIEANKSERHHEFFPAMIATGVHEDLYRYLIMEMLERSLSQLFKLSPKKLTVRQVAKHAKHLVGLILNLLSFDSDQDSTDQRTRAHASVWMDSWRFIAQERLGASRSHATG